MAGNPLLYTNFTVIGDSDNTFYIVEIGKLAFFCAKNSFQLQPFPRYGGVPKIRKVGHVTP